MQHHENVLVQTIMKKHLSWRGVGAIVVPAWLLGLGLLLGACSSTASSHARAPRDEYVVTRTPAQGELFGRPSYDAPITLIGANTVMVPFAVRTGKSWWRDNDPYTAGGVYTPSSTAHARAVGQTYLYPMGGQVRWHNAIIRDMATGQERIVLQDRGVIGAWAYYCLVDSATGARTPRLLAFVAIPRDTNRDGDMNDLDARVLLVAEPNGTNVRAITPADAQVWNMQYDAELDALLIQLGRDTNRDGRIDFDDVGMPFIWRRSVDQVAMPVISDDSRGRVEQVIR